MKKLEQLLIEKGYKRHRYDHKTKTLVLTDRCLYSSMGDVCYAYIKNERKIVLGLSMKGLPPTLIHPRPRIILKTKEGVLIDENFGDRAINIVMQKESVNDIYKAIYDKSICFKYDLS